MEEKLIIIIIIAPLFILLVGYVTSKLLNYKPEDGNIGYFAVGVTVLAICIIILSILNELI